MIETKVRQDSSSDASRIRSSKLGCIGPGSGSLIIMIPIRSDDLARNDVIFPKTPGYRKDAFGSCRWAKACMLFFALLVIDRADPRI